MRPCPHCGLGVVEEDAVCPYCGHDMPPVVVSAPEPPDEAAPSTSEALPPLSDLVEPRPSVFDQLDLPLTISERQDVPPVVPERHELPLAVPEPQDVPVAVIQPYGVPAVVSEPQAGPAALPEPQDFPAAVAGRQDVPPTVALPQEVSPAVAERQDGTPRISDRPLAQPPVSSAPPSSDAIAAPSGADSNRGLIAVAAIAAVVIGAVVLMQLRGRTETPAAPSAAAAVPARPADRRPAARPSAASTRPPAPKPNAAAAPRWMRRTSSNSRNVVEYQLTAVRDVPVWMSRVRPILVVRCAGRDTEVVVLTHSAASFESPAGRHTVRIGLDGQADAKEQWIESDNVQALFAPDGVAMARRIAATRAMRFGFTPHNAPPVTVEFNVSGFDALVASVAKACRWGKE
jgi:hypothetical protein